MKAKICEFTAVQNGLFYKHCSSFVDVIDWLSWKFRHWLEV